MNSLRTDTQIEVNILIRRYWLVTSGAEEWHVLVSKIGCACALLSPDFILFVND